MWRPTKSAFLLTRRSDAFWPERADPTFASYVTRDILYVKG